MIMIHLREHVHRIGIECQIGCVDNAKSVKLMAQGALAEDELSCVCPVQTVYAVRPADTILDQHRRA